ncbi:MAG: hypothetical protein EOM67_00350 [Spirochaetia bacterium]|nr:hypothetical protein [Spirochaetia bacterium]
MKKSLLLFSNGIDSYIGKYFLRPNLSVYLDMQTKYSLAEKHYIKKFHKDVIVDEALTFLGEHEELSGHIEYRNLFLTMYSLLKYSPNIVYICGLKDDKVSDKTPEVFEMLSSLVSKVSGKDIVITSPFWDKTKADICKEYIQEKPVSDLMYKTYSCYEGGFTECGSCPACLRKRVAIYASSGVFMPFYNLNLVQQYESNIGNYDLQRQKNMKEYFYKVRELDR